jgi:hypothetical protein
MEDTYTATYNLSDSSSSSADPAVLAAVFAALSVYMLIMTVVVVITIAALWKLFERAHKPGWAALVPVYNYVVLLEVIGRPLWWLAMMFVPFVNLVFMFMMYIDLAKSFGKDTTYGVLLALFAPIMLPALAFGKHTVYVGPVGPEHHGQTAVTPPAL